MTKRFVTLFLSIVLTIVPLTAYAIGPIVEEEMDFSDETLTIGHYDAVTKTETTETISLSELKAHNEAMKIRLGMFGQNVLNGFDPTSNTSVASVGDEIVDPQTVFGEEGQEQTRVNVNNYPYRCVMFLLAGVDTNNSGTPDKWSCGTGFLVGNDVMITAAHVFYEKVNDVNVFVDECRIYPLQASTTYSNDRNDYYFPKSWTYSTMYATSSNKDEHDWIVATLFTPLGLEHGYFAVRDWDASIEGVTPTVSGYPIATGKTYFQYKSTGPLTGIYPKRMSYRMDTHGGNSGGPVYINGNQIIGIHTGGGTQNNWALRIFEGLYTIIENRVLAGEELYG